MATAPAATDYRAALERELEERLAKDDPQHVERTAVRLLCVQCRTLCDADAQFCTGCGTQFNAMVVGRVMASTRAGAA